MLPDGEIEGPRDAAQSAPQAHTVYQRPWPQAGHASRPLQRLLGVIWHAFVLTYPEAIAVWILDAELGHAVESNVQLGNR